MNVLISTSNQMAFMFLFIILGYVLKKNRLLPDNATAVGVPARIVRINGEKPKDLRTSMELDQVHVSDPVEQALQELRCEVGGLQQHLSRRESAQENPSTEK